MLYEISELLEVVKDFSKKVQSLILILYDIKVAFLIIMMHYLL
jgi:hypothetical protein